MPFLRNRPVDTQDILNQIQADYLRKKKAAQGENELEREIRITRVENGWAQASLSPSAEYMFDGTPKTQTEAALEPPKDGHAKTLAIDFNLDTHVVVAGESWDMIAAMYGVFASDLQSANPRVPKDRLVPGTRLTVPSA